MQVRDAALKLQDNMPKSDVNKEYYTQNMEREVGINLLQFFLFFFSCCLNLSLCLHRSPLLYCCVCVCVCMHIVTHYIVTSREMSLPQDVFSLENYVLTS